MKVMACIAALLGLAHSALAQERASVAPKNMQAIAPALADYTDDVLFGDVWRRPGLAPRDRSLVTVAVLVATGKAPQLQSHLGRALTNGVRPAEIAGLVTHLAFYSGWPNAVSSLNMVEQVFGERKIDPAALQGAAAPPLPAPASDKARALAVEQQVAPLAPKLAELTNDVLFGDLWRRQDLSPRDRSLVTIAALAANREEDQIGVHIQRGMENGLTRDEIAEALTHLAFYAGWPKAMAAVAMAGKAFAAATPAAAAPDAGASPRLQVVGPGAQPATGPATNFTGSVTVSSPFKGTGDARLGGATVTFQPGAHSNWHTHPLGQLLVISAGRGWVQAEGEPVRAVGPGDVVWTAPGVKHWHGATRSSAMTHVAIAEAQDGIVVRWLEPVTDAQYQGPE
jgi:4-carboxymuconolactone decarboxylase